MADLIPASPMPTVLLSVASTSPCIPPEAAFSPPPNNLDMAPPARAEAIPPAIAPNINHLRSEERFSRNAETDLVCRLLLEKKKIVRNNASDQPRDNLRTDAIHIAP